MDNRIRKQNIFLILIKLMIIYIFINIAFALLYFITHSVVHPSKNGSFITETAWYNYIYFTFISVFTIGYGDFIPSSVGKIIVICQSSCTAVYFALMVSVLSLKLFYPGEPIKFSEKVIYNLHNNELSFRMINTNREPLINPEISVSITEHNVGNVIAGFVTAPVTMSVPYLGKHDFTYSFSNHVEHNEEVFDIYKQKLLADQHNEKMNTLDSRFRITITITGNYGMQQIATYKKYYANEVETGKAFKAIQYNDEDQRKNGEIRYSRFPKFWSDFNFIIK